MMYWSSLAVSFNITGELHIRDAGKSDESTGYSCQYRDGYTGKVDWSQVTHIHHHYQHSDQCLDANFEHYHSSLHNIVLIEGNCTFFGEESLKKQKRNLNILKDHYIRLNIIH